MAHRNGIREELNELRAEIAALGGKSGAAATPEDEGGAPDADRETSLEHHIKELNGMVKTMLDEAETAVTDHPVATVAGALALGIVIGRLTAR